MKAKHIALLLILTLLLSSFASANLFTDIWTKITGNTVSDASNQADKEDDKGKPDAAQDGKSDKDEPKPTSKGLLKAIENQLRQLSTAFTGDRKAQAALKRLGEDLNKLKTLTGQEPGTVPADGADDGLQGFYDALGCEACGNGVREGNEQCDGSDLGIPACNGIEYPNVGWPGDFPCTSNCTYGISPCSFLVA